MSNRNELKRAREKAGYAEAALGAIQRLPRRVGQCVRWTNGVIWERVGDDQWRPWHFDDGEWGSDDEAYGFFSSEHVGTSADLWNPIELVPHPISAVKS